jgi:hypothetical protein
MRLLFFNLHTAFSGAILKFQSKAYCDIASNFSTEIVVIILTRVALTRIVVLAKFGFSME